MSSIKEDTKRRSIKSPVDRNGVRDRLMAVFLLIYVVCWILTLQVVKTIMVVVCDMMNRASICVRSVYYIIVRPAFSCSSLANGEPQWQCHEELKFKHVHPFHEYWQNNHTLIWSMQTDKTADFKLLQANMHLLLGAPLSDASTVSRRCSDSDLCSHSPRSCPVHHQLLCLVCLTQVLTAVLIPVYMPPPPPPPPPTASHLSCLSPACTSPIKSHPSSPQDTTTSACSSPGHCPVQHCV